MTGATANPHRIDPLTRLCMGCGQTIGVAQTAPECPAFYRAMPGLLIIVTTAEKLVLIVPGQMGLRLEQAEMLATRDAIEDGLRELRDGGRSTVRKEQG